MSTPSPAGAREPLFLQALDDVHAHDDRTYTAKCPTCPEGTLTVAAAGNWTLRCSDGCTHDDLVRWLSLDDLRADRATHDRAWVALMLAPTPEIWAALLEGDPVDPAALDQLWLRRFKRLGIL